MRHTNLTKSAAAAMAVLMVQLFLLSDPVESFLIKVVIADCLQGTIWIPPPRAVKNACMQCLCVHPNYSLCKTVLILPHVACAVIEITTPTTTTTDATTTSTSTTTTTEPSSSEEEE